MRKIKAIKLFVDHNGPDFEILPEITDSSKTPSAFLVNGVRAENVWVENVIGTNELIDHNIIHFKRNNRDYEVHSVFLKGFDWTYLNSEQLESLIECGKYEN